MGGPQRRARAGVDAGSLGLGWAGREGHVGPLYGWWVGLTPDSLGVGLLFLLSLHAACLGLCTAVELGPAALGHGLKGSLHGVRSLSPE